MSLTQEYVQTDRERRFLERVVDTQYKREIINGLAPFLDERAPADMATFYSSDELVQLRVLKGTARDVEKRMPVKVTRHYYDLATKSKPMQRLVKASPDETMDLAGSEDPGHQMDYSPVEGLLHKYEMGLLYAVSTCSAHCRFCYREELIARKEIERKDGTVAKKGLAEIPAVTEYIRDFNAKVAANGGRHPDSGREKLREILLSGGDPMVLNNSKIAAWLGALAECGVESIRIGTKEMAFYPKRFDETFLAMLDAFHETYPQVGLHIMVHFEHPDEFLVKDDNGQYVQDEHGFYQWVPDTGAAMRGVLARSWITVENQTPIIRDINDDPDALRIMQREIKRVGADNHYFFCGRDIVAYKAFNVPIERAWQILNESQKGLSGVEAHARLSITHYKGKTEVVAVTNEPIPGLKGAENGVLIFKLLRSVGSAPDRCKVCIVGRNPKAIWFNDYEDRVLFDEAGLFDYSRVKCATSLTTH
jgi:L-lysine 2,3-aminomutase